MCSWAGCARTVTVTWAQRHAAFPLPHSPLLHPRFLLLRSPPWKSTPASLHHTQDHENSFTCSDWGGVPLISGYLEIPRVSGRQERRSRSRALCGAVQGLEGIRVPGYLGSCWFLKFFFSINILDRFFNFFYFNSKGGKTLQERNIVLAFPVEVTPHKGR